MTKKIDHASIARKIDAIPSICSDGKKAVASLLQEFGYKPPPEREPKVGEVWYFEDEDDSFFGLMAHKDKDKYFIVPLGKIYEEETFPCSHTSTLKQIKEDYTEYSHQYNNIVEYAKNNCP